MTDRATSGSFGIGPLSFGWSNTPVHDPNSPAWWMSGSQWRVGGDYGREHFGWGDNVLWGTHPVARSAAAELGFDTGNASPWQWQMINQRIMHGQAVDAAQDTMDLEAQQAQTLGEIQFGFQQRGVQANMDRLLGMGLTPWEIAGGGGAGGAGGASMPSMGNQAGQAVQMEMAAAMQQQQIAGQLQAMGMQSQAQVMSAAVQADASLARGVMDMITGHFNRETAERGQDVQSALGVEANRIKALDQASLASLRVIQEQKLSAEEKLAYAQEFLLRPDIKAFFSTLERDPEMLMLQAEFEERGVDLFNILRPLATQVGAPGAPGGDAINFGNLNTMRSPSPAEYEEARKVLRSLRGTGLNIEGGLDAVLDNLFAVAALMVGGGVAGAAGRGMVGGASKFARGARDRIDDFWRDFGRGSLRPGF